MTRHRPTVMYPSSMGGKVGDESFKMVAREADVTTDADRGEPPAPHELIHGRAADAEQLGGLDDGEQPKRLRRRGCGDPWRSSHRGATASGSNRRRQRHSLTWTHNSLK